MKPLLPALLFIIGCTPKPYPEISINDWSENTHSTAHHITRDTYTVVISYLDMRKNDTIETFHTHFPTNETDVIPEYFTGVPSFRSPDNEHAVTYMNVKGISVLKATISANNINYIQSQLAKQDSGKILKPVRK